MFRIFRMHASARQSIFLLPYPSIYLSVSLIVWLSVYLSMHVCICTYVNMFMREHMWVYLHMYIVVSVGVGHAWARPEKVILVP